MNFVKLHFCPGIKLILDYLLSVICLILLIPVILMLTLAIKISGTGPVIYSQERIGKSGKPFILYKFRSMTAETKNGYPLLSNKNDSRVSKIGRFMRKHKFDEIPNFINVLKGEMSLVGPRPEQKYYIDQITLKAPQYKLVHSIKPGITSWGQVKYGYASTVDEMIERLDYDLYYLENKSFWFDIKVLFHTIGIIVKGQGI